MNDSTTIGWTETTWNPLTGCTKISEGCRFCYAEFLALTRLQKAGNVRYRNGFQLTLHSDLLELPLHWRKPRLVFVNSMSDLFHKDVPLEFQQKVFATMNACAQHRFQVLTKRADLLEERAAEFTWTPNIWMGVTVESSKCLSRIDHLRKVPARVRFLSLEPLLSPLAGLDLSGIHWVIVGGESGKNHRPMETEWVRAIRDQCLNSGVKFFFKQWSASRPAHPALLDGKVWEEMPQ